MESTQLRTGAPKLGLWPARWTAWAEMVSGGPGARPHNCLPYRCGERCLLGGELRMIARFVAVFAHSLQHAGVIRRRSEAGGRPLLRTSCPTIPSRAASFRE